jgi:hypothetical protein
VIIITKTSLIPTRCRKAFKFPLWITALLSLREGLVEENAPCFSSTSEQSLGCNFMQVCLRVLDVVDRVGEKMREGKNIGALLMVCRRCYLLLFYLFSIHLCTSHSKILCLQLHYRKRHSSNIFPCPITRPNYWVPSSKDPKFNADRTNNHESGALSSWPVPNLKA